MGIAAYKDLCIDARDAGAVAAFWGELLGLDVQHHDDGDADLRRDGDAVIWVNRVGEPKATKNRVHLDLWVAPDTDMVARGAALLATQEPFQVFADPEGNELCAFAPPPEVVLDAPARWFALCTDSADPVADAAWWAGVVGGEVGPGPDGSLRYLQGADGLGDVVWKFVPEPEERSDKNRWHWDVTGSAEALVAAGATVLRSPDDEIDWTVLTDPAGNEFCAFTPDR